MAAHDTPAHETALLVEKFRSFIPQLPTSHCRAYLADLAMFQADLKDGKSFVNKHLSAAEKDAVLHEKQLVLSQCVIGFKDTAVPHLYTPNKQKGTYGGVYERIANLA